MRVQALVATAVAACSVFALAGCAAETASSEEAVASSSDALSAAATSAKPDPQFAYAIRSAEDLRACPGDINDPSATTPASDVSANGYEPAPVQCDAFVAKKLNSDESWQLVDAAEIHNLRLSVAQAQRFQSSVRGNGAIVIGSIVIGSRASIVIGSRSSIVIGSRSAIVIGSRSGIVIGSRSPAIVIGSRVFTTPVALDPSATDFFSVSKAWRGYKAVELNSSRTPVTTPGLSSRAAASAVASGEIIVGGSVSAAGIVADTYLPESKGSCSSYGCIEATACVR